MPAPLLARLSVPARSASPFIRGAVREGTGADSIFSTLRSVGVNVTRAEVRVLAGAERAAIAATNELRQLSRSKVIPLRNIPIARTTTRRRFAFVTRVTGIDSFSGAQVLRHITISSSKSLSRADIENRAIEASMQGNYGLGFEPITATLTDAMQGAEFLT